MLSQDQVPEVLTHGKIRAVEILEDISGRVGAF